MLWVLVLIIAPAEIVHTNDSDKNLSETYSPDLLDTILKIEKLLDKNLNNKVIEILNPLFTKKSLNDFEKSSVYFLFGTAHYNLKNFSNANTSFLSILAYNDIPIPLYLESLRKLSVKFLDTKQKEFVLERIKIINNKEKNIDMQLSLAEFLYHSSDFIRTIETLDLVVQKEEKLTATQLEKLNELLFFAHVGNSELPDALKIIETTVGVNPTKTNLRRLAYIYALMNKTENHLNIWETINDNFLLDRYETKYFYELLLKREFHSKAERIFNYGLENGFFEPSEKLHNDSLKTWLQSTPSS